MLLGLSRHLELVQRLRTVMVRALTYPVILMLAAMAVLIFIAAVLAVGWCVARVLPSAWQRLSATGGPGITAVSYVIGGLASSTLLTLLVVPLLYTLFDDLSEAPREVRARQRSMLKRLRLKRGSS